MISFVVPFRSEEPERIRSFKYVHAALVSAWPDDEVIVSYDGDPFSRAKARNVGVSCASGDVLVFVDADSWVPEKNMEAAIGMVESAQCQWALPYDIYYSLTEGGTAKFYAEVGLTVEDCVHVFPSNETPEPAVGGGVVVSRKAVEEIGGYDERFVGWGYEDTSFVMALETLCGPKVRIPGPLWHLWHPSVQTDQFAHEHFLHNRDLFLRYQGAFKNRDVMRALVSEH